MRTVAILAMMIAIAGEARAQEVNAGSEARAKVLFDEGKTAFAEGQYGRACEKLDASFKLSRLSSTRGLLAACYEKIGKLASAWVGYRDAAAIAEKQNNAERAAAAKAKADELFPKLAFVAIDAAAAVKTPGFTLTIDGVEQPINSLSSELPIDAGPHVVVSDAPHYKPAQKTLDIQDGEKQNVTIEALVYDPSEEIGTRVDKTSGRKIVGISLAAGGGASVGIGIVFGVIANVQWSRAQDAGCTDDGLCPTDSARRDVDSAARNANLATIAGIAGIVVGGAGLALYLTAPRTESLRVTPTASPTTVGAMLEGRF